MTLYVLGLNHNHCPVGAREKVYFSRLKLEAALRRAQVNQAFSELFILSTCNRVELYCYGEREETAYAALLELLEHAHDIRVQDYNNFFYRFAGKEAIRHFLRVAAGLDSMVIGENEILVQIRDAFRAASEAGTVHSLLYRLIEKALQLGKKVRTETKINEGAVSIPSVAVELAEKIFGRLDGHKVMVLGTGEMSAMTLENLHSSGAKALCVISRNRDKGEKLAARYESEWISMENREEALIRADILIASTSAPHTVIDSDEVRRVMSARRHRPLFLIDIAVPRDIDPEVNVIDDVYLYNVDDLKTVAEGNLELRRLQMCAAGVIVEEAVTNYSAWVEQLKARPALERFENYLNGILDQELRGEDKTRMKDRIRSKLMHAPISKIKEASRNGGVARYLEALSSLFHLDKKEK